MMSSYIIIARSAGLGLGQPEVKPSTPGPLLGRLRELPGKLGWMKWEPLPLFSEGRRSLFLPANIFFIYEKNGCLARIY